MEKESHYEFTVSGKFRCTTDRDPREIEYEVQNAIMKTARNKVGVVAFNGVKVEHKVL